MEDPGDLEHRPRQGAWPWCQTDEGGMGAQSKLWDLLLGGQESPSGQWFCTQHERGPRLPLMPLGPRLGSGEKAQVPRPAPSLPGRPPASASGPAWRRAGTGAGQQQLAPLEHPPGATAFVPRPHPSRSQAVPHPQTPRSEEAVRDHLLGNLTYPGYQAQPEGGPARPRPRSPARGRPLGVPAGIPALPTEAPGQPLQPSGTV